MVFKFQSASICTDVINFVLSYLDFMFLPYARPILRKSRVAGGGQWWLGEDDVHDPH